MKRGTAVARFALVVAALLVAPAAPASADDRPNIVLILADDMGYADLGCFGGEIATPRIDALAARGLRWTQFYNAAQCCPTRAALLTGLYPHQAGIGDMIDGHSKATRDAAASPAYAAELKPNALTIAERLRPAGYQTLMVGKWHVGRDPGERPVHRGFEQFFGMIGGADSYWKPKLLAGDVPHQPPAGFYATDAFTDRAIEMVRGRDRARPFFLYLAYNAPHAPLHARDEDLARIGDRYSVGWEVVRRERFERMKRLGVLPAHATLPPAHPASRAWESIPDRAKSAERMAKYAALVERLDWNVGRVLDALEEQGIVDDTLVVFLSDNGAWAHDAAYGLDWAQAASPFRLFKTYVHEGGVRTPLVVSWPARLKDRGRIETRLYGHVSDLAPTLLAAAGVSATAADDALPLEGENLLPKFLEPAGRENAPRYWERLGRGATRDGRWKLVRTFDDAGDATAVAKPGPWELYDLEADPTESRDLAADHPDRVAAMSASYHAWERRVGVVDREVILQRIRERGLKNEP